MTLFAVAARAASIPLSTSAASWLAYWLFPIPNQMRRLAELPQPAAVGRVRGLDLRHGLAAVLVHRPGPGSGDAARPRDDARSKQIVYGILALGWRGSHRHWLHYETAYLILAGLSTPLVLSVHTIVSLRLRDVGHPRLAHDDLPAVLRRGRRLQRLRHGGDADDHRAARPSAWRTCITIQHLENMNKIILATGIHGRLRLRDGVLHRLVLAATRTSASPSSTAPSAPTPGPTGR